MSLVPMRRTSRCQQEQSLPGIGCRAADPNGNSCTVNLLAMILNRQVCGIPRPGDHGFGDDDSETGLSAAEPIECIAFSVVGPANAPIVSSLEIKYANHNILLHGTVRGRRSQMFFDLNRREHVTQVRLDCGGPADKRKIQFISIKSNLGRIKADGKSNPADSHTFDIRGKRVVSFRGYTNRYDTLQTLGIGWAREGFGKKP